MKNDKNSSLNSGSGSKEDFSFLDDGGLNKKEGNDISNSETNDDIIYKVAKNEFSSINSEHNSEDLILNVDTDKLKSNPNKLLEKVPDIYIVSKSKHVINNIRETLNNEHYNLVGVSNNSEEAFSFIEEKVPDLVFISLDLDGKFNGEDLGKFINKLDIPLIYIFNADDDLSQNGFLETNYGFIFEDYSPNEIKFVIKVALKKHENNIKSVVNAESKVSEKNIELGIEKLYSALLLFLSVVLIICGIISRNVTFLQWIIFIPSVLMIFLAIVSLFKMRKPTPYDVPPFVSVIIPAHNEQYTIEDTVRSIANMDYSYKGEPN